MRTVTLLRHAEAAEAAPEGEDHDRPLTKSGRKAAAAVGRASENAPPDLVLCSTAARTRETFSAAAIFWKPSPRVVYEPSLYLAPVETILARIRSTPDHIANLWLIGHNPGIGEAARALGDTAARHDFPELFRRFPTAASARFALGETSWSDLQPGRLTLLIYARA